MKKLFLLIPALVLSLAINAKTIDIAPGTSLAYTVNDAEPGDVIVMADGLYPGEDQIKFVKDITIKAAEGATPVVQTTYYCELKSNAKVFIEGITFDGSSTAQQFIRTYDATAGKELHLSKCEFKNYPKDVISGDKAEYTLDSCVVTNCYFHNNNYSPIYFNKSSIEGQQTIYGLIVKNSTFANNDPSKEYRATIDVQSYNRDATDDIEVLIDHCTFYNNTTINYDYSAIRTRIINRTTVSNCIFAHPSLIEFYATNVWAGTVTNCLAYNLNKGYMSGPTRTKTNTGDPLFTDAANGDFTFAGDWTTMSLSPARGAATDGSDLGDPRWYSAEILPEVDFTSPYQLIGAKAQIAGNLWYNSEDAYLYYNNKSENGTAKWKIHAERACVVGVELNMHEGSPSVHKIRIEVRDAEGNSVGEFAEQASTLPGTMVLPSEGDYTIILNDDQAWTSAQIDNITLSYIGGAVQAMPGTTDISEAWFSSNGTRANGAINYSSVSSGCWAKWNISVANAAWYNVTANIKGQYGHNITVDFFEAGNATPVATATEGKTVYGNDPTSWAASVGLVHLEAGEYEMKFSNSVGDAALIGIALTYVGGNVINISPSANTTLPVDDAWFTNGFTRADGQISPGSWKPSAPEPLGFVKWNIATEANATYDLTLNFSSTNAHSMAVNIYEDEDASPVASISESYTSTTGSLTLDGNISLVGGKNYVVVVTNPTSGSEAKVTNIVFAPVASSSAITLPNTLDFNDAILFGTAFVNEDKLYFAEHGKESQIHEDITGAWAVWNVTVETAGTFLFTLNASSTNGQSYKISIMDGETEIDSYLKNPGEGEVEMKHYFYLEPGNYSVKVQNKTQWSHGYLTGLVVTQPDDIIVLSENATDNSAWLDKFNDGNSYKVQIMRSFTGGMYNTICLPIYVSGSEARKVFGEDVVLKVLDGANLDDTESILELNFKTSSDIWQGTPHLIKPSKNIVNPVFENVQFKASAPSATTKDQADFVGTFVATNIPAGEENLFLGRNDLLYFNKSAATPVGGFRAWFVLHDIPDGPHFIKGARIVERENTTTGMENVDQLPKANSQKLIENGMLIIIRDGVRYNVMGVRVE